LEKKLVRLHLATTEEVLARSAGEVQSRESFDGNAAVPGGLFCEEIFGAYSPTRCGCQRANLTIAPGCACPACGKIVELSEQRWGPLAHIMLAEPVLHPLAHSLFAELVEVPIDQITGIATGERLWIHQRQSWAGGLLNTTSALYYNDNAKDAEPALSTINALRELVTQTMNRDAAGLRERMGQAGVSDVEQLFLRAVPVLPSLARGICGECKEADMQYLGVVCGKEPFATFTSVMPFSFYRLVSAKFAKSVYDLFDLKRVIRAMPKQCADRRVSLRNYLEKFVGKSLPLDLTAWHAEIDIPDTIRIRALVESLALCIDN
jgi:hypothetical protein